MKNTAKMFRALNEGAQSGSSGGAWVKKLERALSDGADANMVGYDRLRPLWSLAALTSPAACKALLASGANPSVESPRPAGPGIMASWAVAWGRGGARAKKELEEDALEVFRLLTAGGARIDAVDVFRHRRLPETSRCSASLGIHHQLFMASRRGLPLSESRSSVAKTFLGEMVGLGDFEAAKVAIDHGASLEATSQDGRSVLMECLEIPMDEESLEMFLWLLAQGASPERICPKNGDDILAICRKLGRENLAVQMEAAILALAARSPGQSVSRQPNRL